MPTFFTKQNYYISRVCCVKKEKNDLQIYKSLKYFYLEQNKINHKTFP